MIDNNYLLRKKRDDSDGNWALAAIKQAFSKAAGEADYLWTNLLYMRGSVYLYCFVRS